MPFTLVVGAGESIFNIYSKWGWYPSNKVMCSLKGGYASEGCGKEGNPGIS